MSMFGLASVSMVTWTIVAIILLVFLLIFVLPGFALVRDYEVGILTKRLSGKKLPQGKIIATEGEIGVQADTLMPGLYWRFPIIWKINKSRVTQIPQGSIGIVESRARESPNRSGSPIHRVNAPAQLYLKRGLDNQVSECSQP